MAITKTCYKVVIASPSDVVSERKTTLKAIKIINESFKESTAFLEPYTWETDADPSFHPKGPQGIIDEALNIESSDIFIGIFYLKFGTPAIDSDSGTVHEVMQAIEVYERNNTPEIKLYFKRPSQNDLSALNEYDLKQYESVKNFKKEMYSKGIIVEFDRISDFRYKLIKHFNKFLLRKKGVIPEKKIELRRKSIKIENEIELVKAIDSNRELVLMPGKYDLSSLDYLKGESIFHEEVYDGLEIIIKGLNNLSIISENDKSELTVSPRYANVLTFRNSENITITNLIIGHSPEPGECSGGVLIFENCKKIIINNSILFGCGVEGLKLIDTDTFIFNNSLIKDCNQGIMSISKSSNIHFIKSKFEHNQIIFCGIGIAEFSFVEFEDCIFINNYSYKDNEIIKTELIHPSINSNVLIRNSQIVNNSTSYLSEKISLINLENIKSKGNYFKI